MWVAFLSIKYSRDFPRAFVCSNSFIPFEHEQTAVKHRFAVFTKVRNNHLRQNHCISSYNIQNEQSRTQQTRKTLSQINSLTGTSIQEKLGKVYSLKIKTPMLWSFKKHKQCKYIVVQIQIWRIQPNRETFIGTTPLLNNFQNSFFSWNDRKQRSRHHFHQWSHFQGLKRHWHTMQNITYA